MRIFLILLIVGITLVFLVKVLERRHKKLKSEREGASEIPERHDSLVGHAREFRTDDLLFQLEQADEEAADAAMRKLLSLGAPALEFILPAFRDTQIRREEETSILMARRLASLLADFGRPSIRPCLDLLIEEKGLFEIYYGVRDVFSLMGESAALPLVERIDDIIAEGLYTRSVFLFQAAGPNAVGPVLRFLDNASADKQISVIALLRDLAPLQPAPFLDRARQYWTGGRMPPQTGLGAMIRARQAIIGAVRSINPPDAADIYMGALRDNAPLVRIEAVGGLSDLGTRGQALRTMLNDPDSDIIRHAIYGLSLAGDKEALSGYTPDLTTPLGCAITGALARFESGPGREALAQVLEQGCLELQKEAAYALGIAGGRQSVKILVAAMDKIPLPLRRDVGAALGQCDVDEAVNPIFSIWEEFGGFEMRRAIQRLGRRSTSALAGIIHRRSPFLMEHASYALGTLHESSPTALGEILDSCEADDPALMAVEMVLETGGTELIPYALTLLDRPQPHQVQAVVRALSFVGSEDVADALMEKSDAINDPMPLYDYLLALPAPRRDKIDAFIIGNPKRPGIAYLKKCLAERSDSQQV